MPGLSAARPAVLLLSIPLLCGCIRIPRETLEIQRYAINPPPAEEIGPGQPQPLTIRVLSFGADASFRGDRILFRSREHRLDPYFYHRWVAPPARLLEDLLARAVESWGIARDGVIRAEIAIVPTHEIHGRLLDLYADHRSERSAARLAIELTMVRVDRRSLEKEILFQKTYRLEEERGDREIASFIAATNRLVERWLLSVRYDLAPILREEGGAAAAGQKGR